jgi:nucleotide-binding universal stress UspA family protein
MAPDMDGHQIRRQPMFKKILFATTASPACDNAAKVAFDLELKWDAKLFIFHVLGVPSRGYSPFVTDVRTGETEPIDPDYADWVKEEMKHKSRGRGIQIQPTNNKKKRI